MVAKAYIQMQNQTHKNGVPSKVLCMFKNAISLIIKQLPPPQQSDNQTVMLYLYNTTYRKSQRHSKQSEESFAENTARVRVKKVCICASNNADVKMKTKRLRCENLCLLEKEK